MIARLFRHLDRLCEVFAFCGMALISVAIGISMVDIVGRKTVGFTILGIVDMTQLLVMACICLALPFAFIREGHVGVDFVTDPLPPRLLAALKLLVAILSFAFVATLARYAIAQAEQQINRGDSSMTLAIPIAWYWAPLLIGLVLSALACLAHAARHLVATIRGADPLESSRSGI
jgi:TRAP-type C4-dicarboxylate transport system permease small subunit